MEDVQQYYADSFKAYWFMAGVSPAQRRAGLEKIQQFESADWYPSLFERAVSRVGAEFFAIAENEITVNCATPGDARIKIFALIETYLDMAPQAQIDAFTTRQAMMYVHAETTRLGKALGERGVKRYIDGQAEPRLNGRVLGRTKLFTKAELDAFVAWYVGANVKPGRKAKQTASPELQR
jgi:hypothetical protein